MVLYFNLLQTHNAMEIGRSGRVQVEDIVFLVRKDPKKYARVKELLMMNEELKKARKAFDEGKFAGKKKKKKLRLYLNIIINTLLRIIYAYFLFKKMCGPKFIKIINCIFHFIIILNN